MNKWKERLDKHPIHDTLSWLESSTSSSEKEVTEGGIQEERRLNKIINQIRNVLTSVDPELIPFNQVDSLNNHLRHQNVAGQVNAYVKDGNPARLSSINEHISSQLTQISILRGLCNSESSSQSNQIEDLENLVDNTIDGLIRKRDDLKRQLNEILSSTSDSKKKLEALSAEIKQKEVELTNLSTEWQSQFSSAQEGRSQEFSKWRDGFTSNKEKEANDLIERVSTKLEDDRDKFDQELGSIIEDSKSKHQAILELYELTAGDSVGAAYINSANNEGKQADKWRIISVNFIILTVCWLLFSYFKNLPTLSNEKAVVSFSTANVNNEKKNALPPTQPLTITQPNTDKGEGFHWQLLLITASISGVLLWGAAYSAQQSTRHRNNEKKARWFALEVKAFDPFISSLDQEQQRELKKQLAERIFGQGSKEEIKDSKVVDEHALNIITNAFGTLLSKLPSK